MFKDPWNEFILYSCRHPCLRVGWAGSVLILPWTIFVPPCYFSHPKTALGKGGLREISPAGKHSQLSNLKDQFDVARMDQSQTVSPTLWSPGSSVSDFRLLRSKGEQNNQRAFCRRSFSFSHVSLFSFMSCCDRVLQFEFIWCWLCFGFWFVGCVG